MWVQKSRGHLGPLSYICGYRGSVGRRGVGQDTTRDDGIEIRARYGRYELILWRCAAGFVPKSALVDGHRSRYGHQQLREIGVGLSGALHSLIGAHAELVLERAPMRRAEANARRYMRVRALWEP